MRQVTKREQGLLKLPTKKRVAAYCRVSLEKESMLHSLSAQVSYYSEFIQNQRGWQYVGVYADDAISGTSNNRPEFLRLLADARQGKIDMIITKSISRWARNTLTMLETVRELKSINVDVYFEKENIHSMSGDGELMLTILGSFAQEESLSVSENCKWRIRKRFEAGEIVNLRFMFGYRIIKGVIDIDEEQAKTVRMIFDDYINGLGFSLIATKLRNLAIPSLRGGVWSFERIAAILKNEKYIGDALLQKKYSRDHISKSLVWNKGQLPQYYVTDTHPAIIDVETFQKAQELMAIKREQYGGKEAGIYPFTSKIVCGDCGKNYRRKVNYGIYAWQCSTYLKFGKDMCEAKKVPDDILKQLATEVLELSEFDDAIFKKEIEKIIVTDTREIVFVFYCGKEETRSWDFKSRKLSWSDEDKFRASQKERERCKQ